jgi:Na+/proline symporter
MLLMAAVLVMTTVYAQARLPRYTEGNKKVALTRVVLVLTGIGFGLVPAAGYPDNPLHALLACLIGFGAVHAPAAIILFVKQQRGSGRT